MASPAVNALTPPSHLGRPLVTSLVIHALLYGLLIGLGKIAPLSRPEGSKATLIPVEESAAPAELTPEAGGNVTFAKGLPEAFQGRSLEKPLTAEERSAVDVKKIQTLSEQMAKLKNLNLSLPNNQAGKGATVDSKNIDKALDKVRKDLLATRQGISGSARAGKLQLSASGSVTKTIGPAEEAKVRETFEGLQSKFSAIYDAALKEDPNLTLVLTYEGTVDNNGYLSKLKFKAQGTYTPKALEIIQQQMNAVLTKVNLGKNLSAVIIRGERLFVQ